MSQKYKHEIFMCACSVASVVSDSLRPYGLWPTRLLRPWTFPGKNPGVGCHFLLQGIFQTQGSNQQLLCLLHRQEDSLPSCLRIRISGDFLIMLVLLAAGIHLE